MRREKPCSYCLWAPAVVLLVGDDIPFRPGAVLRFQQYLAAVPNRFRFVGSTIHRRWKKTMFAGRAVHDLVHVVAVVCVKVGWGSRWRLCFFLFFLLLPWPPAGRRAIRAMMMLPYDAPVSRADGKIMMDRTNAGNPEIHAAFVGIRSVNCVRLPEGAVASILISIPGATMASCALICSEGWQEIARPTVKRPPVRRRRRPPSCATHIAAL